MFFCKVAPFPKVVVSLFKPFWHGTIAKKTKPAQYNNWASTEIFPNTNSPCMSQINAYPWWALCTWKAEHDWPLWLPWFRGVCKVPTTKASVFLAKEMPILGLIHVGSKTEMRLLGHKTQSQSTLQTWNYIKFIGSISWETSSLHKWQRRSDRNPLAKPIILRR